MHRPGVLFDLDDTLYDERSFVEGAMGEVARFLAAREGVDADVVHGLLLEELNRSGRGRVFDVVLAQLDLPLRLVPTLVYVYRSARPRISLFDDAGPLLDSLLHAGFATGVLTDGSAIVQDAKIDLLGLRPRLDVVILTDAVGAGSPKPHVLGFQVGCDLLGIPPERVWYVGNDLRKDYAGPRRLGIRSIHVARRQLGEPAGLAPCFRPDVTVRCLADVRAHVIGVTRER